MTLPRNAPSATRPRPHSSGCWRLRGFAVFRLTFLTRDGVLGRSLLLRLRGAIAPCSARARSTLLGSLDRLEQPPRAVHPHAGDADEHRLRRRAARELGLDAEQEVEARVAVREEAGVPGLDAHEVAEPRRAPRPPVRDLRRREEAGLVREPARQDPHEGAGVDDL